MSERELGASQERRRILAIVLAESALQILEGNDRIAHALESLAHKITQDHNQDNEQ